MPMEDTRSGLSGKTRKEGRPREGRGEGLGLARWSWEHRPGPDNSRPPGGRLFSLTVQYLPLSKFTGMCQLLGHN